MKRRFFNALILTATFSVYGCGTITAAAVSTQTRYTDTTEQPRARLRVIYGMFDYINLTPHDGCLNDPSQAGGRLISKPVAKSGINIVSGNSVTFEEKLLGIPSPPFELEPNSSRVYSEFFIPAGRTILIGYANQPSAPGGWYCPGKLFAFTPKPDRDYEAELKKTGRRLMEARCFYNMYEIVGNERRPVTDGFEPIKAPQCNSTTEQKNNP